VAAMLWDWLTCFGFWPLSICFIASRFAGSDNYWFGKFRGSGSRQQRGRFLHLVAWLLLDRPVSVKEPQAALYSIVGETTGAQSEADRQRYCK